MTLQRSRHIDVRQSLFPAVLIHRMQSTCEGTMCVTVERQIANEVLFLTTKRLLQKFLPLESIQDGQRRTAVVAPPSSSA
jgi:hypothetical protein